MQKLQKERKLISDLNESDEGKERTIAGWLYDIRDLGKIRFVLVRDVSGILQVTAFKGESDSKVYDIMGKTSRESVVVVKGKIVKNAKAPSGRELVPDSFEVLSVAEQPLPVDVSDFSKTEISKRLDYRFLDLHRKKIQAIFKIQSEISMSFREFFKDNKFIEVQLPSVISASSEGGTELFSVKYFEKEAYLAQSPQLYKQMLACSMEKIFTITPVWRAEKHNTIRHLNESRQMDIELAFADDFCVMEWLEKVVCYMVKNIKDNCKEELKLLEVEPVVPSSKYLSYEEAVDILNKHKVKMKMGDDFSPESERKFNDLYPNTIVFIYRWPSNIKPFYIMPLDDKKSAGFDAIYQGMEISSGGQRIHDPEVLTKILKKKGMNPKDFESYIDSFRYGAPPHAGWSIGLERFTMLVLGLGNIREAVLFPRDRDRLSP